MENKFLLEEIKQASFYLKRGDVIAFPTETVMGFAIVFNNYQAYLKMNKVKLRREDKPYTMMVKDINSIDKYAYTDERINKVIKAFMPGSLTILLKAKDNVPGYVSHDTGVIGIRIPSNIEALTLLKEVDIPLLVPSANRSGEPPCKTSNEVIEKFKEEIPFVISGKSSSNKPSTIVDFTKGKPSLIREGELSFLEILKIYEN